MTTYREKFAALPVDEQNRIKARAQEILAEEITLRNLRKARQMTQATLGEQLGIKQENVSRIEKRSDLLLSTLTKYVEGMGGKLRLVAEFPNSPPITLTGIQDLEDGLTDEERASILETETKKSPITLKNDLIDGIRAGVNRTEPDNARAEVA